MIRARDRLYGQRIEVFADDPERWETIQSELLADGVGLPLEHRHSWLREMTDDSAWYVVTRDEHDGSLSAAFPVMHSPTRSLPGHFRSRVTRFGYGAREAGLIAALELLPDLIRRDSRTLTLNVEIFTADHARRQALENAAQRLGYERLAHPRRYRRTALVDLEPDLDEIAMSFTQSCRRFIRNPEKKGYAVEPVRGEGYASRMDRLWQETFARTGTRPPSRDWPDHLAFARDYPELYQIVGTFDPRREQPKSLLAFVCAKNNGEYAVYSDGASTRHVESGVALTYAPMWEVIRWAKQRRCDWFDIGGITTGTDGEDDPRDGISDFKRRFTENILDVGTEWRYRPASARAMIADAVSGTASAVRDITSLP